MKKLGIIVMAVALMMGMSQCKKENTTASNDEGAKVPITLNVSGTSTGSATGGSRVAVEGSTGVVTFEDGDALQVVSNGVYVGTMTYNGTVFSGEINEPTEGQKLQFYFLGNKTPEFNSDNTGCSVIISDQTEYLPVISYAPSRENYQIGKTDYNATLLNKCALVKFDVTSVSESATCILGMNNKVTVDFSTNEFTYSQEYEGIITLAAGNGEKWAILLPQAEVSHTITSSNDGIYSGSCGTIPVIEENDYLTNGIAVAISHPTGAINGLFSVSATQQVYFSKGNLQYIGSAATPYWKFAENQWDYFGTTTGQGSNNQNIDRDFFGWGTSGYNHGAASYQPWSTSTDNSQYYVYGSQNYNLYDQTGQADWGYNAIANGGNMENSGWRTLTNDEWDYVINTRTASTVNGVANLRYVKAIVNDVKGAIFFPDVYTHPDGVVQPIASSSTGWNANNYSSEDFAQMEANGAVFLPAAGVRGSSVSFISSSYWSSTCYGSDNAYSVYYNSYSNYLGSPSVLPRPAGYSVRLVRNVE